MKTHWITPEEIRPLLKPRAKETHKGTYGHLLLIGGSATKPGAILLAGKAALRTGAGLVTVALPDKAFERFPKNFLELMYEPLPSSSSGTLSRKGWKKLAPSIEGKSAVGVGPGMGVNADTKAIVAQLIKKAEVPLILDADALNCLSSSPSLISPPLRGGGRGRVILTPHPGEMARLLGISTAKVQKDRIGIAQKFSKKHGVVLVLKGHRTVIATPSGEVYINSTGNPGMATAGMGDVLTGIIASLIGQGMSPEKAAIAGVFLHGRAGDHVAKRLGDRGLLATDVIEEIPLAIKELLE